MLWLNFTIDNRYYFLAINSWHDPFLCRAAVLERMPVIEKNSPGHTNGESTGEAIKEIKSAKVKQGEPVLPQQPANQVHYIDTDFMFMTASWSRLDWWPRARFHNPISLCLTSFRWPPIEFQDFTDNFSSIIRSGSKLSYDLLNIYEPVCQHRSCWHSKIPALP